ncbi:hypothetical protein PLICRDRAFT_179836 [Plicaturopsis crispa FD-325 SS-3]|uniref:DUF6534 domain-containing protein n=1 Tax=Plicaturopsis crispa FD-325 SS-3 TaxID=944288 RepID=A0A0C9SKQ8_PLICR|nr:hypothetical protein PLICRDRAFT_179836 [Plicaturopsis crispa FD-325 SS-3]
MATLGKDVGLDNTLGACLIGVIASAVLYGVTLVQSFFYFTHYPKDVWILKVLVSVTVVCDTAHLCMISHTVYHYLVRGFDDREGLQKMVWSVLLEALFTGVTGALVQTFFVHRIWRLSKKNIFVSITILILVLSCASCGTAWVVISLQMHTFEDLLRLNPLTLSINAITAAADVIIAASLVFLLTKSRTGFKRSDTIITRLVVFTVNTGLLTSVCAISSLIAIVASPDTLIYATFYFCIGRLYANSLLATLNARKSIRGEGGYSDSDMSLKAVAKGSSGQLTSPRNVNIADSRITTPPHNIAIQIETTREYLEDQKLGVHDLDMDSSKSAVDANERKGEF